MRWKIYIVFDVVIVAAQGRGNYFEVRGGGGKRLPRSKVTPTQNKRLPGFGPLFFGRDPRSRAKSNKNEKINDFHSPKLGGGAPTAPKLWGQVAPLPPPTWFPIPVAA